MSGTIDFGNNRHIGSGATPTQLDIHAGKVAFRLTPENAVGNDISRCMMIRDTGSGALYPIATALLPEEIPLHLADGLAPMQPSKYYKDQFGIVHISIAVKATTARTDGSLIATMPEGFRPTQITEQPAVYKNRDAVGTVQIMPNGQIIFFCTNGMMENQMLFGTLDFVTGC